MWLRAQIRTIPLARGYSTKTSPKVFDKHIKRVQRNRAAGHVDISQQVDYIRDEAASRLCERLLDIKRSFPKVLDLGANTCNIAKAMKKPTTNAVPASIAAETAGGRVRELVAVDSSEKMLFRDEDPASGAPFKLTRQLLDETSDESENVPFEDNTFDAVLSSLSLHWVNDLPKMLTEVNRVLKPDCPFIGVMTGGDSLFELRTSLQLASVERLGGVGMNVSPLADVRDVGGLLQKAGFRLLTVDVDDIVVDFPNAYALMQDLQAMGEQNCLAGDQYRILNREVLAAADSIYRALHGNSDGSVPATFRLIFMIGWKAGPDQPTPLARGTGMVSIKDVLEGKIKMDDPVLPTEGSEKK